MISIHQSELRPCLQGMNKYVYITHVLYIDYIISYIDTLDIGYAFL